MLGPALPDFLSDPVHQLSVGGRRGDLDDERHILGAGERNELQGAYLHRAGLYLAHDHAVRAGLRLVQGL